MWRMGARDWRTKEAPDERDGETSICLTGADWGPHCVVAPLCSQRLYSINKNWCFLLFLIETWLSLSSLGTNWEFQHVSTFFFVTSWLQRSTGVAVVSVSKMSQADRLDDGYTMECKTSKQRVTQLTVGVDGLAVVMKKNFGKKVMRNRIWGSWRHAWTMDNTQTKNTFQRYTFIPFLYQR